MSDTKLHSWTDTRLHFLNGQTYVYLWRISCYLDFKHLHIKNYTCGIRKCILFMCYIIWDTQLTWFTFLTTQIVACMAWNTQNPFLVQKCICPFREVACCLCNKLRGSWKIFRLNSLSIFWLLWCLVLFVYNGIESRTNVNAVNPLGVGSLQWRQRPLQTPIEFNDFQPFMGWLVRGLMSTAPKW